MIGRIVDSVTSEGIPFVSVVVRDPGTFHGAQADGDGNFSIPCEPTDYLAFATVGYFTKLAKAADIAAGGGVVTMAENIAELDPVIVTPDRPKPVAWWPLALLALLAFRR